MIKPIITPAPSPIIAINNNQERKNEGNYDKCGKKLRGEEHYGAIGDGWLLESAARRWNDDKGGKKARTGTKERLNIWKEKQAYKENKRKGNRMREK